MQTSLALPHWVWPAVLLSVCVAALWRGGRDERVAASAMLAAWVLTTGLYSNQGRETEWGLLAVDAALFVALTLVALRSHAYWPMFAAGFQLLGLVTHLASLVDTKIGGWAYITGMIIWGYLVVFALAAGAIGAWRDNPQEDTRG